MASLGLSKDQKRTVVTLLVGAVLVVLNQTLLSPALPDIMVEMNVDETTVQWLTSAYSMTEAVVIPLAAWFMGRFSTRKLFIGGMSLFAIGTLVAALAPMFPVLLLGRVLQAMATGVMMVMVMSLILLTFPREKRGQAMGLVSLVIAFAPAVGPTVGGLLVEYVGWRALFVVIVVLAIVVILLAAKMLQNREGFPRTKADPASIILSTLGLIALLYGLSSFSSGNTVLCVILIIAGIVIIGFYARRQFNLEEPMLRLEVLKSRRYRTAVISIAFLQAVLIGLGVLMPLYIQNVLGYSALVSGLATLPGAFLGAIMSLVSGKVFDRSGVRKISLAGTLVLVIGAILMLTFKVDSPIPYVILGNSVLAIGIQMLVTPVNTWGVNSLDNKLVEHATSVTNTMNQIGGSLGTALIVSFSAFGITDEGTPEGLFAGYHLSFIVVTVLSLISAVCIVLFVRNKKSDNVQSTQSDTSAYNTVADVMDKEFVTVPVHATIEQTARAINDADASGAVVVDDDRSVQGFVSNSDILRMFGDEMQTVTGASGFMALRMLDNEDVKARTKRLANVEVMEIATKNVISIAPSASFEEACRVIADRRLKSLPVIENDRIIGMVRRRTLMRFLGATFENHS